VWKIGFNLLGGMIICRFSDITIGDMDQFSGVWGCRKGGLVGWWGFPKLTV